MQALERYPYIFAGDLLRYALFAGIPFLIFYVLFRKRLWHFKIQSSFPDWTHIKREVFFSITSMLIFAAVGSVLFFAKKYGYTKLYTNFNEHSVAYFIFSTLLFIFAHDTYFYFTHRLMHHKKVYRYVHIVHHQSTNPTPWAAFAFHPIEALVQVGIVPLMLFTVPLHPFALLTWSLYQLVLNVGGHLGYELFRKGFTKGMLRKWHNTSTHHNMHHRHVNCNYGLYFNIWDRWLGTNHPKYDETFEQVCNRRETEATTTASR